MVRNLTSYYSTSYYSKFLEAEISWNLCSHISCYCLHMEFVSSVSHLGSKLMKSVCMVEHPYLLILSNQHLWGQFLCWMLVIKVKKTQDRTSFNTQRVSWLAENHRFQHDWAQCFVACFCQRGKKSWTDELVFLS